VARQLVARGESVRVLVRASSSNRAISDLALEYVTGDLRDAASLDRSMAGVKRVYHVAADYRLWAKRSQDIYDSNVGGTKNLLAAAKRAGVEQLIYTSTVATIAVDRPELPNEFTDAKLEEMVGHYKRSKWMAEREALQAAREGLPVIVAMPTTPVGPWDWKPTPTGKIILDFLNGKMPGYVETGLNFVGVEECAAGHLLVAEKGKVGERYLLGAENLTLKALLDLLARSKLPREGVADHIGSVIVAREGTLIIGCVGVEIYGTAGLLRSVAVDIAHRGLGLGIQLTDPCGTLVFGHHQTDASQQAKMF